MLLAGAVLALIAPGLWWKFEFRESAVIGLTPTEVIDRFGLPMVIGSDSQSLEEHERGKRGWPRAEDVRARLLALDEFVLGYRRGFFADIYEVRFENGVAKSVRFLRNMK